MTLTHATTLVRNEIIEAVTEFSQKLFSDVPLEITSYMLANYYATRLLLPHIYDVCLVDITNEATEIGIVRDGSLQYSTHVAFGRASIAREITACTKTPLQETFRALPTFAAAADNPEVKMIYNAYVEKIYELFQETGDRLTIPKNVYLETDSGLEELFTTLITKAGEQASKGKVAVTVIKDSIQKATISQNSQDTPLLVAGSFFHTNRTRSHFEYL